jgi:phage-related minor tail protein
MNPKQIRELSIRLSTSGESEVTNSLNKVANAQDKVAQASEKAEKVQARLERRLESLKRSLDLEYRQKEDLAKIERDLNRAREQGLLTSERQSQLMGLAQQRFSNAAAENVAANQNMVKAQRQNGQAMAQLSFQINDVVTSLASGISPFQTLAQQGGQIFQIWQQSPSVFGATARAIGSIVTPARLAGGTLLAAAGIGFAAYQRWQGIIIETNRALLGTGKDAGITTQSLLAMADAVAKVQGGSAANARGTLNALANTGRIAPSMLTSVAGLQRDLAATLGIDAAEANKLLASSFADPVRGAEELNRALGGLGRTTQDYILRLVQQGREQEALQILLERTRDRIGKADELTGFWTRSWQGLTAAASGAADAIGRALDRMTGGGQSQSQRTFNVQSRAVNDLENQKKLAEDNLRRFREFPEAVERWSQRLQDVNRQLEQARNTLAVMPSPQVGVVDPVIEARSRRNDFESAQNNRRIDAGVSASREMGAPDRVATDNLNKLIGQYETLRTAQRAFQEEGRRTVTFKESDAEAMTMDRMAERARERALLEREILAARKAINDVSPGAVGRDGEVDRQKALQGILTTTQQINEEGRIQRLEATATTAAQREAAALERQRFEDKKRGVQAGGEEERQARGLNSTQLVRTQIEQQLTVATRQRIAAANENIKSQRDELGNLGASAELQERNRIVTQMTNDALRERRVLYGENATLPDAEAAAIRRVASEQAALNQQIKEGKALRDVQFERDQMFRTPVEQAVSNRLRGIYGEGYNEQQNSFLGNQIRINESFSAFARIGEQAFSSIADGFIQGKNAGEIFSGVLRSIAGQLAQMAVQSLFRSAAPGLFGLLGGAASGGGNAGTLTSLFSSSFSSGMGAFASGGAFYGGNVIPFASGGVTTSPTYFPMSGGRTGLMGEAGPEAILPLRRGPNGALGVQMHGGNSSSVQVTVGSTNVVINGGASDETVAQLRNELDARDARLRRELPRAMADAQRNRKVA